MLPDHVAVVLDAIADGVTVWDHEGQVVYANAIAASLPDLNPGDMPAHHVLAGEDAREALLQLGERWTLVRSQVMRGPAGERWAVNTFRDVTEQKRAESRLELALAASQMGVWEWNLKTGKVFWSPEMERLHGLAPGSFDGTVEMYRKGMHPDDRDSATAATTRNVQEKRPHYLNYRIVRSDGAIRWIEAHGQLAFDAHGEPERLVGVSRDVTEQRQGESTRVRKILDSLTDPFSVLDSQLRIVHCNEVGARMVGKTPQELIGHRIWDIAPEMRDSPAHKAYEEVMRTSQPVVHEEFFPRLGCWFESSIYPLDDGIVVYTRDVTIRKQAVAMTTLLARHNALRADVSVCLAEERELARMLQRTCDLLVEHLDVAFARIWTLDEPSATLLLQASAGMYTHLDGPHRAVPVGKFKIGRIAESKKPHLTNDVPNDPQVGNPQWAAQEKMVSFAGYPLLVDGEVVGVMAMFSRQQLPADTMSALASIADLVAQGLVRRRTELELEQRVAELARSNADLEQFAYVASHDLQEPLRMVASYNQLLARRYKGKLGDEADEFIGFTVEGVTRMQRLINDLLAYSRVGTRVTDRVDLDLEKVLGFTLQNLERAIVDSGAQITHDPLPHVLGDEGQLIQLLQNLIGNALKFCSDDVPKIHIGVREARSGVVFSVRDNGIGIDPQYFERIFVIFQRLNSRDKYPGTGIGLAICKKIVERHGGRIWLDSAPGKGATVNFTIPFPRRTT